MPDNRNKELVLMMPTGAGKTTLFDVAVPRIIMEDPGSILIGMQTDPDAGDHWDSRLEPSLLNISRIKEMIDGLARNKKRKGQITFPHMTLYCGGSNITNFQRKSVRWVLIDEAWLVKFGLIDQARARTHDRWNQRVVIVSQGGCTHQDLENQNVETELETAWNRTDRRQYSMVCPECSKVSKWQNCNLIYQGDQEPEQDKAERIIIESATYVCPECKTVFPDKIDVKRQLSASSIYVPSNLNSLPGYVGWHVHATALYYVPWGQLALEWYRAMQAKKAHDLEPMKTYIQKRCAENWAEETDDPNAVLTASDYRLADYIDGQLIDGEAFRFITIDRQRDHFWLLCRAWRADGSSRLIYEGRIETIEMCRALQLRLKVKDSMTFEDAQHEPGQVYDDCARWGWIALHGSGLVGFLHHPKGKRPIEKLYSPVKTADAPTEKGKAKYIFWSNEGVKDQLAELRSGRGPAWEIPIDVSENYKRHMVSETKRDIIGKNKQLTRRWVPVKASRPNHLWDCEAMQVAVAIMLGIIQGKEKQFRTEEEAAAALETH